MTNSPAADVLVVGAGLAGLSAAIELKSAGRDVLVIEASDGPGGRVRTDLVDGYRLDRGFQILLTAYPEAQRMLNYGLLDLRPFHPGALIRTETGRSASAAAGGFARLGDPFRRPTDLVSTVRAPVGSLADKARILQFRQSVNRGSIDELWRRPETTARQRLEAAGFSDPMIDGFLQPLFAGITLDAELSGSSRSLEFVFRMLSRGEAAVPAAGMGEIPNQLAARLADDQIRYNCPAQKITADSVQLADGQSLSARSVVVATDASSAAELTSLDDRAWNGVTSIWFSADRAPIDDPIIALNGTGSGPINNLAVMSNVSPRYAPAGKHLIVVSTPTVGGGRELVDSIEAQLSTWFTDAPGWERLRVDEIPRSQPALPPGADRAASARLADGLFVAGDHRTDPSINGAMLSGVRAARAIIADR